MWYTTHIKLSITVHTFGMSLYYLGKLEIQSCWKLHCALKNTFYFISFKSVKSQLIFIVLSLLKKKEKKL